MGNHKNEKRCEQYSGKQAGDYHCVLRDGHIGQCLAWAYNSWTNDYESIRWTKPSPCSVYVYIYDGFKSLGELKCQLDAGHSADHEFTGFPW